MPPRGQPEVKAEEASKCVPKEWRMEPRSSPQDRSPPTPPNTGNVNSATKRKGCMAVNILGGWKGLLRGRQTHRKQAGCKDRTEA